MSGWDAIDVPVTPPADMQPIYARVAQRRRQQEREYVAEHTPGLRRVRSESEMDVLDDGDDGC